MNGNSYLSGGWRTGERGLFIAHHFDAGTMTLANVYMALTLLNPVPRALYVTAHWILVTTPMPWGPLLSSTFYKQGNCSTERLGDLSKVTQPVRSKAMHQHITCSNNYNLKNYSFWAIGHFHFLGGDAGTPSNCRGHISNSPCGPMEIHSWIR